MASSKRNVTVILLFSGFLVFLGRQGPSAAALQEKASEDFIVITVQIPPGELLSKSRERPYRVRDKPYIKVIAKNDSDQRVRIRIVDPYYQNRPRLFKNGQLFPYRKEVAALIRSKDADPEFVSLGRFVSIAPYASAQLAELDLNDWYGTLEAGSYRLINRYRPELYGSWTADSEPLVFEVVKQE